MQVFGGTKTCLKESIEECNEDGRGPGARDPKSSLRRSVTGQTVTEIHSVDSLNPRLCKFLVALKLVLKESTE